MVKGTGTKRPALASKTGLRKNLTWLKENGYKRAQSSLPETMELFGENFTPAMTAYYERISSKAWKQACLNTIALAITASQLFMLILFAK